jgi:hypothetical protein
MPTDKKRFKIGASASYVKLAEVARLLGVSEEDARSMCSFLEVPVLSFKGQTGQSVLLYALETALFSLGLPKKVRSDPAMVAAHQELAAVIYGTLTREALKERVDLIAKALTSSKDPPKIKRTRKSYKSWTGRKMD